MTAAATVCRVVRRFLSAGARPPAQTMAQISMHQNLEEKWQRLPLPKENLLFRVATLADKAEVLNIEPDIHYGMDYLQDYYDEIVSHESRCGLIAVDKVNNKICLEFDPIQRKAPAFVKRSLTFVYTIVNDGGRNLSFGGGRTLASLRDYGLMSFASRAIYEHLAPRLQSLAGCCGVYNLPVYTRRFFERRSGMLKVALHHHQLGFECPADFWAALGERFERHPGGGDEPRLVDNPADFLCSKAVCSGTESRLFQPDQYLLISKESLMLSRGNLLIWEKHLKQVMCSRSESSDEVSGVSIGNWNSVPVGGLHLVLNVYCRTEACAVAHVAAQLRAATQRLRLADPQRHRVFVSVFVPSHLMYNEVLSGVRVHPLLRDLPPSLSPKLACDIRIGAWTQGSYI